MSHGKASGLPELLRRPSGCRVSRDTGVENSAPVVREDEKHVEDLKANRWDSEEIDRHHCRHVVVEERSPGLRQPSTTVATHVLSDAGFTHVDTQPEWLAVDTWSTPQRVLAVHPSDKGPNVCRNGLVGPCGRAATSTPRTSGNPCDARQQRYPA